MNARTRDLQRRLQAAVDILTESGVTLMPGGHEMETVREITVMLREVDWLDWLTYYDLDYTKERIHERRDLYCAAYHDLIAEAYPGATITVEMGETSGSTIIEVNETTFGAVLGFGYDDYGEFDGAPEHIHRLEERVIDRLPETF